MQNANHVIYQNACLAEVMLEIKWELLSLQANPGSAIDPFYPLMEEGIDKNLQSNGYQEVEKIFPSEVPIELLPWYVRQRYRKEKSSWPVIQIGPGVLTVNVAGNNYEGWCQIVSEVEFAINQFIAVHPSIESVKIKSLCLKYANAFKQKHGFISFNQFVSNELNWNFGLNESFFSDFTDDSNEVKFYSNVSLPVKAPANSSVVIDLAPGSHEGEESAILQFSAETEKIVDFELKPVLDWFSSANLVLNKMFEAIISDRLRSNLLPYKKGG